jgi:hypothetical protein
MKNKKKMRTTEEIFGRKINIVVDKSLDKYSGKVLFPESVRRANEMIERSTNLEILKRTY